MSDDMEETPTGDETHEEQQTTETADADGDAQVEHTEEAEAETATEETGTEEAVAEDAEAAPEGDAEVEAEAEPAAEEGDAEAEAEPAAEEAEAEGDGEAPAEEEAEAEAEHEEEEQPEEEIAPVQRRRRINKNAFLDIEAEVSSDEEVSDDEDDAVDGILPDLIVSDDDLEEGAVRERRKRKRKKGRRKDRGRLTEDDYELIQENTGLKVERSIDDDLSPDEDDDGISRKRIRLRKRQEASLPIDVIATTQVDRQVRTIADEDDDLEIAEEQPMPERTSKNDNLYDDVEEDEPIRGEARGQKVKPKSVKKGVASVNKPLKSKILSAEEERAQDEAFIEDDTGGRGVMNSEYLNPEDARSAAERMLELFGDTRDFLLGQQRKKLPGQEEDEEEERQYDMSDDEREVEARRRRGRGRAIPTASDEIQIPETLAPFVEEEATYIYNHAFTSDYKRPRTVIRSIMRILKYMYIDHFDLKKIISHRMEIIPEKADETLSEEEINKINEHHITWQDIPERLRTRVSKRVADLDDHDALEEEAKWIFDQAFTHRLTARPPPPSHDPDMEPPPPADPLAILPTIIRVLQLIRHEHLEVPFIVTYRKEHWYTKNNPNVSLDVAELYKIDEYDERWDDMAPRRRKLFQRIELQCPNDTDLRNHVKRHIQTTIDLDDVQDYLNALLQAGPELTYNDAPRRAAGAIAEEGELIEDEMERKHNGDTPASSQATAVLSRTPSGLSSPGGTGKVPKRSERSLLKYYSSLGLDTLVAKIGLSARQFGENVHKNFKKYEPHDGPYDLEDAARDYIGKLPDTSAVIAATRQLAALRISKDVFVRRTVRRLYQHHAVVSTAPTSKGSREMDDTHDYWGIRRLEKKPVWAFRDTQWLLIHKAEQEGFITTSITLPRHDRTRSRYDDDEHDPFGEIDVDPIMAELMEYYLSPRRELHAKKWNALRRSILETSLTDHLYKLAEQSVRAYLLKEAQQVVIDACESKMYYHVTAGPFVPKSDDRKFRIISCCMGDIHSPSSFVALDRFGNVLDYLVLHFMKSKAQARGRQGGPLEEGERVNYERKKADILKFQEFVKTHKPSLILIDASSLDGLTFRDDMQHKALFDFPDIPVQFADPEVARIYCQSQRAMCEFKEYPQLLRLAISLGRRALDPISEISALWSSGISGLPLTSESTGIDSDIAAATEQLSSLAIMAASQQSSHDVLVMHLHPLQSSVPPRLILRAVSRTLMKVVNQVGVDLNRIVSRPWMTGPLQFVSGLGPSASKLILDAVKRRGFQATRADLLDEGVLGPIVYKNCAGQLIISRNSAMARIRTPTATPLDETRIHPESYPLAEEIVLNALEEDSADIKAEEEKAEAEEDVDEAEKQRLEVHKKKVGYIQQLMTTDDVKKLEDLDLELFADMEVKEGKENKYDTYLLIKQELKAPYAEPANLRRSFAPPTVNELFDLLTGETATTFREGITVPVVITRVTPMGVHCRLDNGVRGFIKLTNISDNMPDLRDMRGDDRNDRSGGDAKKMEWLRTKVREDMTVTARIISINREKFSCELSTRSSDLTKTNWGNTVVDEYLYQGVHPEDTKMQQQEEGKKAPRFVSRNIVHALFKNVSREEAIHYLEGEGRSSGDVVVRPSSKGVDHLTITWKIQQRVGDMDSERLENFFHIDVKELDKPNALEIGTRLQIGKEIFEDLDEIVARFIDPMVRHMTAMMAHKNFRWGTESEVDDMLRTEKQSNSSKIPYAISFSSTHPGTLLFSFMPHQNSKRIKILVTPQGFQFQGQLQKKPDGVVAKLKQIITKDAQRSRSGAAPPAASHHAPSHHPPAPHPHAPAPHAYPSSHYPQQQYPPSIPSTYPPHSHDPRDPRGAPRDPRDPRDREPRDPRDPRDHPRDSRDHRAPRDPRDSRDSRDSRDPRDPRSAPSAPAPTSAPAATSGHIHPSRQVPIPGNYGAPAAAPSAAPAAPAGPRQSRWAPQAPKPSSHSGPVDASEVDMEVDVLISPEEQEAIRRRQREEQAAREKQREQQRLKDQDEFSRLSLSKWNVGDACRAPWHDRQYYDATIESINPANQLAPIRVSFRQFAGQLDLHTSALKRPWQT